jgi:hypothetical protein
MLMVAIALVTIAGCASMPETGSVKGTRVVDADPTMTADAIEAMVKVFPPALTPLVVRQADASAFGHNLLEGLRERGYAIAENDGAGSRATRAQAVLGAPFRYRMAPIAGTSMYELVLAVGDAKLSRLYIFDATENRLYPGGEWSRRE